MKAESKKSVVVTLQMNEEEAGLLMGMVQNPFPYEESQKVGELRESIWNALESQGIKPI